MLLPKQVSRPPPPDFTFLLFFLLPACVEQLLFSVPCNLAELWGAELDEG